MSEKGIRAATGNSTRAEQKKADRKIGDCWNQEKTQTKETTSF